MHRGLNSASTEQAHRNECPPGFAGGTQSSLWPALPACQLGGAGPTGPATCSAAAISWFLWDTVLSQGHPWRRGWGRFPKLPTVRKAEPDPGPAGRSCLSHCRHQDTPVPLRGSSSDPREGHKGPVVGTAVWEAASTLESWESNTRG